MTHRVKDAWWRSPLVGTAIVALVLALASCGDDGGATTTLDTSITTTLATTGSTTTTGSNPGTSPPPVASSLSDAIAAVGGRYGFTAVVDIDGVIATRVDGTVYDGTGHYIVTSGDTAVEYIVGPAGQWARQGDGPWTVLAGPAPVVDPLTPLVQPSAITVVSVDAASTVLDATYPASTLGFVGDQDVVVTILIVNGTLSELRYRSPVGDELAAVFTYIDTTAEMTPITAPTL